MNSWIPCLLYFCTMISITLSPSLSYGLIGSSGPFTWEEIQLKSQVGPWLLRDDPRRLPPSGFQTCGALVADHGGGLCHSHQCLVGTLSHPTGKHPGHLKRGGKGLSWVTLEECNLHSWYCLSKVKEMCSSWLMSRESEWITAPDDVEGGPDVHRKSARRQLRNTKTVAPLSSWSTLFFLWGLINPSNASTELESCFCGLPSMTKSPLDLRCFSVF